MCTKMVFVLLVTVGVATADLPNVYGPPQHQSLYKEEGRPYDFSYEVKDDYAGTNFGHSEESDGNNVQGSYTVQLPDGRIQTVTYVADHVNGYQAEVSYEGEAQFPHEYGPPVTFKPQPSYQQPEQTYQRPQQTYQRPEPTYQRPEPTYQRPEPTYQRPEPTYQRPEPTYQRPEPTYQRPEPTYQRPEPTYQRPQPTYQQPQQTYQQPQQTYQQP